jgi:hypothetical protein
MTVEEKFNEAIKRSQKYLSPELWEQVKALLSPDAIALMVVVTGFWAISHFFGVGEIADAVLLVGGVAALGMSAVQVGKEIIAFGLGVRNAETDADLEEAAKHFANAVVLGGITIVSSLFFKTRPKTFNEPYFKGPVSVPRSGPRGPGISYTPKVTVASIPQTTPEYIMFGVTDMFGDITIEASLTKTQQLEVLWHERVHQVLTPKLHFLRHIRIKAAMEGYNRSYVLRYLEEALAESYSLLRCQGLRGVVTGLKFPVSNGYVTIASIAKEISGVFLGPILIGGTAYRVYFQAGSPKR